MAKEKDRFDLVADTGRVGAHRGPIRRGGGWLAALLIVLGIVVTSVAGLFLADRYLRDNDPNYTGLDLRLPFLDGLFPAAAPDAVPTIEIVAVEDPAVAVERGERILILNGTGYDEVVDAIHSELELAGWPIGQSLPAASDIEQTVVYYTRVEDVDLARGLVNVLGFGKARQVSPELYPGYTMIIALGVDHPSVPKPDPSATDGAAPEESGGSED